MDHNIVLGVLWVLSIISLIGMGIQFKNPAFYVFSGALALLGGVFMLTQISLNW